MNHPFDELTKSLAQSVTRRQAFKTFSVGLAGPEPQPFYRVKIEP
jgi:hypothetical protein